MTKDEWENLPQNIRDMIIAAFKLVGKDFERDILGAGEAGSEKTDGNFRNGFSAEGYGSFRS